MVDDGKGKLVVTDSWSPEQTIGQAWRNTKVGFETVAFYHEDGVSMDQEFAWMAFNNYVQAAQILGRDAAYQSTAAALRDQLHTPSIGSWGQLQEWYNDKDVKTNTHRHLSHLVGLFPGDRISLGTTPELAAAARVSLAARGIGPTGWSAAWGANCWATLGDSQKAMAGLKNLLNPVPSSRDKIEMSGGGCVYPNLFDAHPPFQIDGNFGGAHAIIQMLMQSTLNTIDVLPAIPAEWPAGSFTGLRARGGFSLDFRWNAGKLTQLKVTSLAGGATTVRYAGLSKTLTLTKGETVMLDGSLKTF
ncbi:1,2-alpha-L-fucosidase [Renibacterium salmoninarum ATCC 33209]|uniref:1,2-alpha-L-fucosidase n=2 Tax=Renibacterium salmoninarum TaxID=1646 RepID=A9WRZ2_RENSM|nr:1,2-alpha-L-fucosidase [Renibacterium salmoninarum ATCC 33209]